MPRRRALTEAQLESLLALPVTEADLLRHWTLSDDDLVAIGRRRRNHNQLGFALQLCALRYPAGCCDRARSFRNLHSVSSPTSSGPPPRRSPPTPPGSKPATSSSASCASHSASLTLDEAVEETFPASDPISPKRITK